jgi:transglutaminase-like putative cysteine protease
MSYQSTLFFQSLLFINSGLSIFLVQSLRSIGIPARLAGTPAWWGDQSKGDHSWVEVYVPSNQTNSTGQWLFLEPTPGIAEGNESASNADNLDRNPCERWFCKAERFNGSTKTFATRYDRQATQYFPMAWSDGDKGVPGEERTKYYSSTCGKCK